MAGRSRIPVNSARSIASRRLRACAAACRLRLRSGRAGLATAPGGLRPRRESGLRGWPNEGSSRYGAALAADRCSAWDRSWTSLGPARTGTRGTGHRRPHSPQLRDWRTAVAARGHGYGEAAVSRPDARYHLHPRFASCGHVHRPEVRSGRKGEHEAAEPIPEQGIWREGLLDVRIAFVPLHGRRGQRCRLRVTHVAEAVVAVIAGEAFGELLDAACNLVDVCRLRTERGSRHSSVERNSTQAHVQRKRQ